ncbi:Plant self-incompatibility S1 [Spatholobus suberectus]|nr:Plant self-incompatibility S1 [Spatholobus suberectus]
MSLVAKSILLLFVFTLLLVSNVLGRTNVTIINDLEGNQDLTLHCKSKDDDLEMQVLAFNEVYSWNFGYHHFGRTLYFCSFKWEDTPLMWYNIVDQFKDREKCYKLCYWYIKENGPCRIESDHLSCYKWKVRQSRTSTSPNQLLNLYQTNV